MTIHYVIYETRKRIAKILDLTIDAANPLTNDKS